MDKVDLPDEAEDPIITDFGSGDFMPVITLNMSFTIPEDNAQKIADDIEDDINDYEIYFLVQIHFVDLPKICQEILKMYIEKKSFKAIAEELNISEDNARKRKQRCLEALAEKIKKDPKYIDLFIN